MVDGMLVHRARTRDLRELPRDRARSWQALNGGAIRAHALVFKHQQAERQLVMR
jgi:hypothetical protein